VIGKANAQQFWTDASANISQPMLKEFRVVELNERQLMTQLRPTLSKNKVKLSLPLPNGEQMQLYVEESLVLHPTLAAKYPSIKTYQGLDPQSGKIIARLSMASNGFYAIIRTTQGTVYMEPTELNNHAIVYFAHDLATPTHQHFECGVTEQIANHLQEDADLESRSDNKALRIYRLAVSTTGEFSARNGGTKESVLATITTVVNQMNLIFGTDIGVRFQIVPQTEDLIFLDANADPYNQPENVGNIIGTNVNNFSRFIPSNAYDIGHTFTICRGQGTAAGVAQLGSLCRDNKMAGASCMDSGGSLMVATLRVLAHEVGHQLSAQHSWSNCPDALGQLSSSSAYEPGSGSTIMSYSGTCGPQNIQNNPDPYFHGGSIEEMFFHITTGLGSTCGIVEPTSNRIPVLTLPYRNNFFIPIRTPFELTAVATDEDNDPLTYCWEQFNLEPLISDIGEPRGNAPTFRSFAPNASPTRVFPRLSNIINNTSTNAEVLPTYNRNFTFRCTVRDNNPEVSATVWEEVRFRADETAGPFLVTRPNGMINAWEVGSIQSVHWEVANTTNARVNCQRVNIKLSVDGGLTYPFTLIENTLNDGQENVVIPDAVTARARIKVEAADNIFFDISDANFSIVPATKASFAVQAQPFYQKLCLPNNSSIGLSIVGFGGATGEVTLSIPNLPEGITANFNPSVVNIGEQSQLSFEVNDIGFSSLEQLQIQAIAGNDTIFQPLELELVSNNFNDLLLLAPEDNTRAIFGTTTFTWTNAENATSYNFELATNPAFGSAIVFSANNLNTTEIRPNIFLDENTIYFWRVRPVNECGAGAYSIPSAFQTINVSCKTYEQSTSISISGTGRPTVESVIRIEEDGTITDLSLPIVVGSYQPIRFIEMSLISPKGTQAILFDNLCGSTTQFNLGFSSQAPDAITCPPVAGIQQRPVSSLAVFNGENLKGDWKLRFRVKETGFGAGGSINRWSLQSCANIQLNAPFLLKNDTLFTPPAARSQIWRENLRADDVDNTSAEIIFQLVTIPQHGQLFKSGILMAGGDTFTQQDVDGFRIAYEHDGSDERSDEFRFIIRDTQGGWVGTPVFNIAIREDATVNTEEVGLETQIKIYPNPATHFINIELGDWADQVKQVQVFNLQGQLVQKAVNISPKMELAIEGLNSGIYFLQVISNQGILSRKVVIQQ
jgi:hypothetical protein